MIEFKIKNIKISIRFGFFAVIALLLLIEQYRYILWGLYACMIHECGHLIAMSILDVKVNQIIFYGAGIKIVPEKSRIVSVRDDIIILSGGCIINFVCFTIFYFCGRTDSILQIFAVINLVTGIFNLIPLKGFDGARICEVIIDNYCKSDSAAVIKKVLKGICITITLAFSFFLIRNNMGNITLIITVSYFILSSVFM